MWTVHADQAGSAQWTAPFSPPPVPSAVPPVGGHCPGLTDEAALGALLDSPDGAPFTTYARTFSPDSEGCAGFVNRRSPSILDSGGDGRPSII